MIGVLTIVVRCSDEQPASMYRELLESFAAQMAIGASRIEAALRAPEQAAPDASMSKAANYTSGVEMAFRPAYEARLRNGCHRYRRRAARQNPSPASTRSASAVKPFAS